jgi:hypothetical protein
MIGKDSILHVVPRLSPPACGVGDYADLLANELAAQTGMSSCFLLPKSSSSKTHSEKGFQIYPLERSSLIPVSASEVKSYSGLILEYSGYGYAKRGAPIWLVKAARKFRSENPNIRWITMFHELYASGPITSSAFWMRPIQKWVVRELCILSDVARTSCELMHQLLVPLPGSHVTLETPLAVFSNLGEKPVYSPWRNREPNFVIFSSNLGGANPLDSFWDQLKRDLERLNVHHVTIIGKPVIAPTWSDSAFNQPGLLSADEISQILQVSAYGYVVLSPLYLAKSGIFAAFAAHGVVPVIPDAGESLPDGLHEGVHYLCPKRLKQNTDVTLTENISKSIWNWYSGHSIANTAKAYAMNLLPD